MSFIPKNDSKTSAMRAITSQLTLVGLIALSFSPVTRAQDDFATVNVTSPPDVLSKQPVVGAYYYPWYGVASAPLEHDWRNLLRRKLVPRQSPRLGSYRSNDPAVIAEHIKQSRQAGLSFWAVSWWGPDTATDETFRKAILDHPDSDALRYAVLYESTGRLGKMDSPHYDQLIDDFSYLKKHYFNDPHYLRISDRPVVFIYLTRVYFRERGLDELAEVRKLYPEVYIVGDDVFGEGYQPEWAKQFDAVTSYDVYGQSTGVHKATTEAIETLDKNYADARRVANSVGVAFIPAIAPGYNDRAVRSGHPGTARYFIDEPKSEEGSLFRAMIRDVGLPNLDDTCGRLMMVTSFNEWYEDTQIEPTKGTAGVTDSDNSKNKRHFTGGDRYTDYGDLYLEILQEEAFRNASKK